MNKFRNATNARYLKALFYETSPIKTTVLYTLKDQDHEGFDSLYRLYMETDDPTEYTFANEYLDGWEHWQMLCQCEWFKPYIERWREELLLCIQSEALRGIREASKKDDPIGYGAKRFLLEKGWMDKKDKNKSPSKETVKKRTREIAEEDLRLNTDLDRITGIVQAA